MLTACILILLGAVRAVFVYRATNAVGGLGVAGGGGSKEAGAACRVVPVLSAVPVDHHDPGAGSASSGSLGACAGSGGPGLLFC